MDSLLFFTDKGKVYQLKAHEVPDASRTAKGLALVNLISLEPDEQVTSLLAVPDFEDGEYLVMATKRGKIKRTLLQEYSQVRSNGLIAINLEEGDVLGWVAMSLGQEDVLLTTAQGKTIRFKQDEVRPMGRATSGVIGIGLNNGDGVVGMGLVRNDADLLVVTEKGIGKRTALEEYPVKGRATGGVITIRFRSDDDKVAAALVVTKESLLTFITSNGTVMRTNAEGISQLGRSTQGVTILNLKGDRVAGVSCEEPSELNGETHSSDTEVIISPNGSEEEG